MESNQKGDKPSTNSPMTIYSYAVNDDEAKELNSSAEITNVKKKDHGPFSTYGGRIAISSRGALSHVAPKEAPTVSCMLSAQDEAMQEKKPDTLQAPIDPSPNIKCVDGTWHIFEKKDVNIMDFQTENENDRISMICCDNCRLGIQCQISNIYIDKCNILEVELQAVTASIELIRCRNVNIKLKDGVPLVKLDKCDSIKVYLTEDAHNTQIISSNSSSCSICLLSTEGNNEEMPIPERIRTTVDKGRIRSEVIRVE